MHCFSILQIEGVEYDHLKSENAKTWLHFSNSLGNKTSMKIMLSIPCQSLRSQRGILSSENKNTGQDMLSRLYVQLIFCQGNDWYLETNPEALYLIYFIKKGACQVISSSVSLGTVMYYRRITPCYQSA